MRLVKCKRCGEMINREKARRPYLEKELGRCTVQLTNLNISRNLLSLSVNLYASSNSLPVCPPIRL